MRTPTIPARAAALVLILALVPASGVFAQAHKTKHGGGHHAMAQQNAGARAKPQAQQSAQTAKTTTTQPAKSSTATHSDASHQPAKSSQEILAALHSTRKLLGQAGPDPQGHKARATQELSNAIKLLTPQSAGSRTAKANGAEHQTTRPSASGTTAEPSQATSETHLAEAQKQLQTIESQMAGDGVSSHQFTQARNSIRGAIRELNLALVDR